MNEKEKYMKLALKEATKAREKLEVPVGVIIVKNGKIIARAHNLRETKNSVLAHAEILAIEKATKKLNSWRLDGCEMYITLEPCLMCVGAIMNARIKKIYIGALEPRTGAVCSKLNLLESYYYNHVVEHEEGILEMQCTEIIKTFFVELRKRKKAFKEEAKGKK